MPPKSPYTFTAPQSNYLKTHLGSYMKAFDGEDSVNAIPQAIERISDEFIKKFKAAEQDRKLITLSVEMWFNYKAQRIEKKRMLSVELRVHGYDIFRQEKWESLIRPAVVEVLGHDNNRDKEWIGTVQRVGGNLWQGLSSDERARFEADAKGVNSQKGSREYKIQYADKFFKKKLRKFITELAGICEARIMVWTIRDTLEGKDRLVSIIEDDTGAKFMHENHPDDLNNVNWYGGEWLDWMEKLSSPVAATDRQPAPPARNIRDYVLWLGPSGELELPSPDTHPTGSNWASPLAKLIQIAWGRANGLKTQLTPKYKIFAAEPEKYLDVVTYLPPREVLTEDFIWVKPCNMPIQQLLAWAIHLYARQERRRQGEQIEVLAFYAIDKRRKPNDANGERSSAGKVVSLRQEAQSSNANGSRIRADLSDDTPVSSEPMLDKNIVFNAGSPGAAGAYWRNRLTFLRGLCKSQEYQKLVFWLSEHQTRSSLAAPDGWRSKFLWSRWTYTGRWLPSDMYDDETGFQSIEDYVRQWKENLATFAQSKSHIEHLLLLIGLVSRDIFAFQFSTNDPDDVDTCPSYCHNAFLNMKYHDTLMKLLEVVHDKASMAVRLRGDVGDRGSHQQVEPNIARPTSANQSTAPPPPTPLLDVQTAPGGQDHSQGIPEPPAKVKRRVKPRQPPRTKYGNTGKQVPSNVAVREGTSAASPQRISESPLHLDGNGSTSGGMATVPNRPKQTTKKRGRPAIQLSKVATQRTAARPDPVTSPSADEPHPGRKSGRLREKGPTTYTSKGEIIRGGKRINEEIHDQGMTKRARYATPI